jgi:hypothetical protein
MMLSATALTVSRGLSQRRNSFEHFGDEKLSLQLRHVLGYDVSINAQTKRCLKVARLLHLDHDLAQHRSSKVFCSFPLPLPWWGAARLSNLNGPGAIGEEE